jgi:hypothetical protein
MASNSLACSWRLACGWLGLLLALVPARAAETEPTLTRPQVEAAFLYHFGKYVTWPDRAFAAANEPLVIGVLGDDSVAEGLTRTISQSKLVQGRPVRIARGRTAAELARCHILFIGASEQSRLAQHFTALEQLRSTALTVGESEDFLGAGGAIRFVVENQKVRFDINAAAATQAGLSISSKLLSLARNARDRSSAETVLSHAPMLAMLSR